MKRYNAWMLALVALGAIALGATRAHAKDGGGWNYEDELNATRIVDRIIVDESKNSIDAEGQCQSSAFAKDIASQLSIIPVIRFALIPAHDPAVLEDENRECIAKAVAKLRTSLDAIEARYKKPARKK